MLNKELIDLSKEFWENCLPHINVDCVLFGYDKGMLHVLLTKINSQGHHDWFLPGGYIYKDEPIETAATRVLFERTGAENIFLEQFGVFGTVRRSESYFTDYPDDMWHKMRFISVGYYALVRMEDVTIKTDIFSEECKWVEVNKIPALVMDHNTILEKALRTLKEQLSYRPIGLNLLPDEFTMPELQKLYEAVLDKKLNRGNFYRKMIKNNVLISLDKTRTGKAHKAPLLYSFDKDVYTQLQDDILW